MVSVRSTALLGLLVLLGSSVPFLPTGELVSASSALTSGSATAALTIYVICVAASVAGDTIMFLGARSAARHLSPRRKAWLAERRLAPAVEHARDSISGHAYRSLVLGRLVPGGRAPVIIGLGSRDHPLRRFLPADAVACAVWALVYVTLGLIGGRISDSPAVGLAIAIGSALAIGLVIRAVGSLTRAVKARGTAASPANDLEGGVVRPATGADESGPTERPWCRP